MCDYFLELTLIADASFSQCLLFREGDVTVWRSLLRPNVAAALLTGARSKTLPWLR